MGWESRSNGRYYYRKRRIGDRVVSEYVGADALAEAIAQIEELDRERRLLERYQERQALEEVTRLGGPIDEFCRAVNRITEAVLHATGHHKHKRQWRKKRMANIVNREDELFKALKRVRDDKATKADEDLIQKLINEAPDGWRIYGDLYRRACNSTLSVMAGEKSSGWLLKTSLNKRLDALKTDLGYDTGSAIEQLLIEQITLCWLRVYWLETIFSQNYTKMSLADTLLYEKRLTLSQNRFNRSVETLARIRRLARRTPEILQINVAEQQVNQINQ